MDRESAARELGVSPDAGDDQVRRRFRQLAVELHPDRHPGDAARAERFARVSAAYEFLLEAPRLEPRAARGAGLVLVRLRIAGERAWRGGDVEVAVEGRALRVRLPPGALPGDLVRGTLAGDDVDVEVESVDHWPYRREGRDLRARLLVSLHDVVAGAEVDVPTPWGDVRLRIPRSLSASLRLRGRGLRRRGEPDGDLLLDVAAELPSPDAALVAALRASRRPPRIG